MKKNLNITTFTLAQPFMVNLLNSNPTQFAIIMVAKQRQRLVAPPFVTATYLPIAVMLGRCLPQILIGDLDCKTGLSIRFGSQPKQLAS